MYRRLLLSSILLLVFAMAAFVVALPNTPTTTAVPMLINANYDTKFDDVDLDEIFGQERLLRNYIRCLEFEGPCTPDAKMLQEVLPDAVLTDCSKCSEKQKFGSTKVIRFLIDNRPDDWANLEKMYDPQGIYRAAYLDEKAKELTLNSTESEVK